MIDKLYATIQPYAISKGIYSEQSIKAAQKVLRESQLVYVSDFVEWQNCEGEVVFFAWINLNGGLDSISWEVQY